MFIVALGTQQSCSLDAGCAAFDALRSRFVACRFDSATTHMYAFAAEQDMVVVHTYKGMCC